MEKKGLCATCIHLGSCIYSKEQPVWQCEEFFSSDSLPAKCNQVKVKRVVREEITESE